MAEKCEMIIGYLVPHRCENPSLGACVKCGRGFAMSIPIKGRVCLVPWGLDQRLLCRLPPPLSLPADLTTFGATVMRMIMTAARCF
jgi:hypothetical protein